MPKTPTHTPTPFNPTPLDGHRCHYCEENAELRAILKEMAEISYFDNAEGPELRAQNASLHRLAKQAIAKAEGK